MPRVAFTAKTRKYLGSLDAVESVTQYRICYSKEFRDDCMRRYAEGGSPAAIFREAGLDPKIIGYKRVERCIARWKAENAEKAAQEQEAQGVVARKFLGFVQKGSMTDCCDCADRFRRMLVQLRRHLGISGPAIWVGCCVGLRELVGA